VLTEVKAVIDTNVSLGHWPFRTLAADNAPALAERLRSGNIEQAWVGSLDGLFQRDVAGVNLRLADDCRKADPVRLLPFGTLNPMLPDWEDDLRRCHEIHQFRGVRLHPGYHGYNLAEPSFARLLEFAQRRGLVVQIVVAMEDERTQHPVLRAGAVDLRPLEGLVGNTANLRLVILNAFRSLRLEAAQRLAAAGKVYFDIATLEGVDRIASLVERVGKDRVVFGSHFPLFYVESAALKLCETKLRPETVTQISRTNARQLLGP
jgi:predicted TIM-barrel fold metal-dependent hydrolase